MAAGGLQGVGQRLGPLVAEHAAVVLLVGGKAEFAEQGQEARGGERGQRPRGEARLIPQVMFWRGLPVGAVAAPSAGGPQLAARPRARVHEQHGAATARCEQSAAHAGGPGPQDENVPVLSCHAFHHAKVVGDAPRDDKPGRPLPIGGE